jgi:hypothetical protein
MDIEENFYTTAEVAEFTGLSVRRIQEKVKLGHYQGIKKVGSISYIPESAFVNEPDPNYKEEPFYIYYYGRLEYNLDNANYNILSLTSNLLNEKDRLISDWDRNGRRT